MYKVIRSVFIFSLVLVLASCEYWNKDMLGYLEYWSSTVQVGQVDKSGATFQKNNAGIETIPVSATPTITAVLINPKGYGLDATKGTSSGSSVIIDNANVANFVETPVLSDKNTLLSVRFKPGTASLEHQTFTLTFEPVRTDNKLAVPGQSITLRYNTPPAAPMPVVKTETGYEFVSDGTKWEASEGRLYWAYYEETVETKPNCAKSFKINGQVVPVDDCNPVEGESSLSGLTLYSKHTGSASTSVAAVDSEGVTGPAIVSGQVAPARPSRITYANPTNDGLGGSIEGTLPSPQFFEKGTPVTLANKGDLRRAECTFVGWSEKSDGSGMHYEVNKSYTFNGDITLYSKWAPMTEFYVSSNGSDDASHDGSESKPFKTVQQAVNVINDINDEQSSYTIHVEGRTSGKIGTFDSVVCINPSKDLNLTIQGKDSSSEIYAESEGRVMFVGSNNTVDVTVTLKNIKITGGDLTNKNSSGGGIKVYQDTLILDTGAVISGNTATNGGGITVEGGDGKYSKLIMKVGAEIKGNTATNGGGVYVQDGCTFTMEGGNFSGNTAKGNGGAVYIGGNPPTGGPVRFTMKDGVFDRTNSADKGGNHIAIDKGEQQHLFQFYKNVGGKSTTPDNKSRIEVYTAHTGTGYTSYVTDSTWEGTDGREMGDLK